jgi:hypothetical protein
MPTFSAVLSAFSFAVWPSTAMLVTPALQTIWTTHSPCHHVQHHLQVFSSIFKHHLLEELVVNWLPIFLIHWQSGELDSICLCCYTFTSSFSAVVFHKYFLFFLFMFHTSGWNKKLILYEDSKEYTWYLHSPNAMVIPSDPYQTAVKFSCSCEWLWLTWRLATQTNCCFLLCLCVCLFVVCVCVLVFTVLKNKSQLQCPIPLIHYSLSHYYLFSWHDVPFF